jgi:hypothetical protein
MDNMFKRGTLSWQFFELVRDSIDPKDGHSRIVPIAELEAAGLGLGNGGGWCRDDGPLGSRFNIHRKLAGGRIASVQLTGYKKNAFVNKIDPDIVKAYKGDWCRVLATHQRLEIDHKDGRKDDYRLHEHNSLDDFQPLSKPANIAKRDHCKKCAATGRRFDARQLGYSVAQTKGPETYSGSCVGCYWYDPRAFNEAVSASFQRSQ